MPSSLFITTQIMYARIVYRCYARRVKAAMPDQSPLVRQWIMLKTLCARRRGLTVMELVDEMGVSEKTIRRDLETFQRAGFPLSETVEDHGRKKWRINPERNQPGLSFTFDEALALYLARHLMEPLAGTPFWEAARQAFRKIRATLGAKPLKYAERFGAMFHQTTVGASDYSKKTELIDELMIGIEDRKAVFIAYQSLRATEPVTYDVYPYGLTYHRGSLYLIGKAPDHEEIRHWKVDRIEEAEVTDFPSQVPDGFDLKEHLSKSFGVYHADGDVHVEVRFSPTVARYVSESKWHDSQKLTAQKDGSLLADFDLANTEEVKRWILSFGKHARVLEPEELRKEIVEELRESVAAYTPSHP